MLVVLFQCHVVVFFLFSQLPPTISPAALPRFPSCGTSVQSAQERQGAGDNTLAEGRVLVPLTAAGSRVVQKLRTPSLCSSDSVQDVCQS